MAFLLFLLIPRFRSSLFTTNHSGILSEICLDSCVNQKGQTVLTKGITSAAVVASTCFGIASRLVVALYWVSAAIFAFEVS
jgi:hypothetical protein